MLLKNLKTTQEIQNQSYTQMHWETTLKKKFFEICEEDQSGIKWKHA